MRSHVQADSETSDADGSRPERAPSAITPEATATVLRARPREDLTWVNALALALSFGSVPVGLLALVAPVLSVSAVVLGFIGTRAAHRGEARLVPLGYAAMLIGAVALVAMAWVFVSAAWPLDLHPAAG